MIAQLISQARRNLLLALFDGLVDELFDAAAVQTHDMIMVRALVQLENSHAVFKVMPRDQARGLELGENAVHGRETYVLVRLNEPLVNAFGGHVTGGTSLENFEDLESRSCDLEPRLAQVLAFQSSGLLKTFGYDAPP